MSRADCAVAGLVGDATLAEVAYRVAICDDTLRTIVTVPPQVVACPMILEAAHEIRLHLMNGKLRV